MQLEPFILQPEAESRMEQIASWLGFWKRNEDTDSKAMELLRQYDLGYAQEAFEKLHYHLAPDLGIDIVTGSEEVQGSYFSKNAYDFYQERFRTIAPVTTIPFQRIEHMQWEDRRRPTFYVGSWAVMLSLPKLAETFASGGHLALVPAEQPVTASS